MERLQSTSSQWSGAVIGELHQVIHDIEHQWAGKRLLVVGDVMLDKYIWGEVGRIRRRLLYLS